MDGEGDRSSRVNLSSDKNGAGEKFIAALDIGTTTIRCIIFDPSLRVKGSAHDQVELIYPQPGQVEIDPEEFWRRICSTIERSISDAGLEVHQVESLGISTQRSTFITWDTVTGEYYHNFITWKDLRADNLVKRWNSSYLLKGFNAVTSALYTITRVKRFLAGSVMKFMNTQVTVRLAWMIQNNERLKAGIRNKTARFGTLDSWLLYKLRGARAEHLTDVTNATATGFFDPFLGNWASWTFSIYGISPEMLPRIVPNDYEGFGCVDKAWFGHAIPIGAVMGDQAAAMWGSCCFEKGDLKVTLGTGSFLDLNTGDTCFASLHGLYPLVAWTVSSEAGGEGNTAPETYYAMEGGSSDTGSLIKWAQSFGLFDDPRDSSNIALSVPDPDGVFFIPAFSGLGPPVNDHQAATGILGLRPSTKSAHIVRAILESIAFRVVQLLRCTTKETNFKMSIIRVDGGVSQNDFVCQTIADITGMPVERAVNSDASAIGVGFVAGLRAGVWRSRLELVKMRKIERVFRPEGRNKDVIKKRMEAWERALERFKYWYSLGELTELRSESK